MVKVRAGRVAALAALLVVGLCAPLAQPARAATTNYSGSLSSGAAKTYLVPAAAGEVITANLTWSATADLNISLKNPSGAVVSKAFSTPTAGPEKLSYVVPTAGTYVVAASSKTGSATYNLSVSVDAGVPASLTYAGSGNVNKSGKAFQLHDFSVPAPGLVSASVNWPTTSANLNVFLKDPSGTTRAQSVGSSRPENVSFNATTKGTWTVQITAAAGASDYTVNTTVAMGNQPPAANNDTASTSVDTAVSIPVLANDTDSNGQALAVSSVTQGGNGAAVSINGNNTVQYAPASGFVGNDTFSYQACDNASTPLCDSATVTVNVRGANRAPNATNDSASAFSGVTKAISVLPNDSDPDGDALHLGTVDDSPHATITPNADGTVSYRAANNFTGADDFTYEVCDNFAPSACATATVNVTVTEPSGGGDFSGWYYWGNGSISTSMKTTMADPLVGGLSVVAKWSEVETTYGGFNWSMLDNWVAASEEFGKPLLMRIYFGNTNDLPPWLWSAHGDMPAVKKFNWSGKYIPEFWDPTLQRDWSQFVNAMGNRYGGKSKLIVMMTGPWEAFGEPFMPCTANSEKATWTNDYRAFSGNSAASFADVQNAYLSFELNYLLPLFANAFPNQPLGHATGRLMCDNPSNHPFLQQIFNAGRSRYGSFSSGGGSRGFFVQNNALKADPYPITNWLSQNYNPVNGAINKGVIGYQPIGCTAGYCNNGQLITVDEFVTAINIAGNNHASYVELYRKTIEAAVNPNMYPEGNLREGAQKMRQALLNNQPKLQNTSTAP